MAVERTMLVDTIQALVDQTPWISAAWLGGSDATDRTDEFSDIDLFVIVPDDKVEELFTKVEEMLKLLGGFDHRWRLPEPIWHGYSQAVYKPTSAPGCLCLDIVVMTRSSKNSFIQTERHGEGVVLIDRENLLDDRMLDREDLARRRQEMIDQHAASEPVIMEVIHKAIVRGHDIEAGIRYHSYVLRTLIDLMRCEHCPDRFDFGDRYLDRDLPAEERKLLEELLLPPNLKDLSTKFSHARKEIKSRLHKLSRS